MQEDNRRIDVVDQQGQIEQNISAFGDAAAAIFVVPDLLTPLFINPRHVTQRNGLYCLTETGTIPQRLIPQAKLDDPAQLSTVLARTLTIERMLASGVRVIVFHIHAHRKQVGGQGDVDESEFQKLRQRYPTLVLLPISQIDYKALQPKVCTATYCHYDATGLHVMGVNATQIHAAPALCHWGVKTLADESEACQTLNAFLASRNLPCLHDLVTKKNYLSQLTSLWGLFAATPQRTTEQAMMMQALEETIPSQLRSP